MFRSPAPPPHTCGQSAKDQRTASNDDCERCRLEDRLILDTQVADQKKRARTFRPEAARARRTARVPVSRAENGAAPRAQGEAVIRRSTFIPPVNGLDLDAKLILSTRGADQRENP